MDRKSVLVVDDQLFVCRALSRELQEGGFHSDHVLSGKEAIERAKERPYDMFFIDISMPDMDGIEACRALKAINPKAEYVCFTGMYNKVVSRKNSGYLDIEGKAKLLYKPFRTDTFLSLAQKVLLTKQN